MFLLKILTCFLSIRFLEGLTVDSHYMPSQQKQQIDVLFREKTNRASEQSNNLNEITYDDYVKPLYKYGYSVFDPYTLDVKSQWEHRDGDTVRGAYSMLEADGSMRIVQYMSDKDLGFRAIVKKIPNYLDVHRTIPIKFTPSPPQYTTSLSSPPPNTIYRPSSRGKPSSSLVRLQRVDEQSSINDIAPNNLPAQFEYNSRTFSNRDPLRKYVNEIKGSRTKQNYEQQEKYHEQYDNGQNIIPILITKR